MSAIVINKNMNKSQNLKKTASAESLCISLTIYFIKAIGSNKKHF